MKEIYRDEVRTLAIDGDTLEVSGRLNMRLHLAGARLAERIPNAYLPALKKLGEKAEDKIAFYCGLREPVILPAAAKEAVAEAIKVANTELAAKRNDPARIERAAIADLYNQATKIEYSGREDNVETPIKMRIEAERRLEAWRAKYQAEAQKEDILRLLAKADHEDELASGALTYDADGWLDRAEQQKRYDEHKAQAMEYRQRAKEQEAQGQ